MTTATLRSAARDAASLCNWQEAADLLARALEIYPGNPASPMAQHDMAIMRRQVASYRSMEAAS